MPPANLPNPLAQASKFTNLLLKKLKPPKSWTSSTRTRSTCQNPAFLSLLKHFERLPVELVRAIWEELVPILIVQSSRETALREGYMKEYHIVVLASEGTGKSNFVVRYSYDLFYGEYDPTVGFLSSEFQVQEFTIIKIYPHRGQIEDSYQKYGLINGHWCLLDILDSGGCELEWRHDYVLKHSDCILLLFSLTSRKSFTTNLPYWVQEITRIRGMISNGTPPPGDALPCPVVLVGTKSDDAENRCVSREEAEAFAANLNVGYVECSAKLGQGVKEAVHQMVRTMLEHDKASGWKVARKNANPRGAQKKRSGWIGALLGSFK